MERFFISGCQRSGTTMLRLVLESHPLVQCFDEGLGYTILRQESIDGSLNADLDDRAELLGFKIPRYAEQLLWGQFGDPDFGAFKSFYRDQKVVHVVRDVLDVVSSMISLKVANGPSWVVQYGRNILAHVIQRKEIMGVYKDKYKTIERNGFPDHLVGALYWEIKNQGLFDLLDANKPVCPVKYESLVSSPKQELKKIVQFLSLEWSDSLLNHPECPHGELDDNGAAIGKTDPRRSIDMRSVGKYRKHLSLKQVEEIASFSEEFNCKLLALVGVAM